MITKGEEIQILIYRSLDPYLFLSQPYTILAQILIYRSSHMHLFLSNSILPFTQTLSFFVITLFVNRVSDEPRVEKFFFFSLFFFLTNPNLLFVLPPSFFLYNTHTLTCMIFFLKLYSTIDQIPIFFSSQS